MDQNDRKIINPFGDDKDFSACGIFAQMNTEGKRFGSKDPVRAMANMHDRGNGLGGGFAVYGIYPQFKDYYAFHVMYLSKDAKEKTDRILASKFDIVYDEEMQTKPANVKDPPMVWRYFVQPKKRRPENQTEEDYVIEAIMRINTETGKAFVFSSGKDMGVFKGVGFPEDVAEFFCLEDYQGYLWSCHSRFPTNTPGWWGGAHPFNILRLDSRSQRRTLILRHKPPLPGNVRLQMHHANRHRSLSLRSGLAYAKTTPANRLGRPNLCCATLERNRPHGTQTSKPSADATPNLRQPTHERAIQHSYRSSRRNDWLN